MYSIDIERNICSRRSTKKYENSEIQRESRLCDRQSLPNLYFLNEKIDIRGDLVKRGFCKLKGKSIDKDVESDDKYVSGRLDIKIRPDSFQQNALQQLNPVSIESTVFVNDKEEVDNGIHKLCLISTSAFDSFHVDSPNNIDRKGNTETSKVDSHAGILKSTSITQMPVHQDIPDILRRDGEHLAENISPMQEFESSDLTPGKKKKKNRNASYKRQLLINCDYFAALSRRRRHHGKTPSPPESNINFFRSKSVGAIR